MQVLRLIHKQNSLVDEGVESPGALELSDQRVSYDTCTGRVLVQRQSLISCHPLFLQVA